jgi:hypothetical protein
MGERNGPPELAQRALVSMHRERVVCLLPFTGMHIITGPDDNLLRTNGLDHRYIMADVFAGNGSAQASTG